MFPPVVTILPIVLLWNVALNPPLVMNKDVACMVPVVIPVEAFNVPVEMLVDTAFEAVKDVVFVFVICNDADVMPVLATIAPVEMFVVISFVLRKVPVVNVVIFALLI